MKFKKSIEKRWKIVIFLIQQKNLNVYFFVTILKGPSQSSTQRIVFKSQFCEIRGKERKKNKQTKKERKRDREKQRETWEGKGGWGEREEIKIKVNYTRWSRLNH